MMVAVGDSQGNAVGVWYSYTEWIIEYDKGLITIEELFDRVEEGMTLLR